MWAAALRHTEMAQELATLRAVVSSITESMLGHSPEETFHVEVVDELVVEFQRLEEWLSHHEQPGVMIYDLLLRPPPDRARLGDRLHEAVGQLGVELATRWEVNAELEALQTLAA
jgi:hypothetical protein